MKIINPSFMKYWCSWPLWKGIKKNNHIFLTFDDGPHPKFTIPTLHMLKKFNVKATFFLTGEKIIQFPGIVEEIIKNGHTLGNHGFSHDTLIFKKKRYILEEIDKTSSAIKNITGETSRLFRPPHGWFDFRFKKIMQQKQMVMVLWTLLSYDFMETSSSNLFQRVTQNIKTHDIVVFHDGHDNASVMLQSLPDILAWIADKKWTISGIF